MKFLTSDPHWGHHNIIRYANRPFSSVEEMDLAMINNWNSVVSDRDEVYCHGDMFFHKGLGTVSSILGRLKGKIYLIRGNHDKIFKKEPELLGRFEWIKDYFELRVNHILFTMFHFPILSWHEMHRRGIHTHGHSHGTIDHLNEGTRRIDVGVDPQKFFPISIDSIINKMSTVTFKPIDHHGQKKEED